MLDTLSCSLGHLSFECFWEPGRLPGTQCDELLRSVHTVNSSSRHPLNYGFFDTRNDEAWRSRFLERSAWCVIRKSGRACGFAYQYVLGRVSGRVAIHSGLIKSSTALGREAFNVATTCLGLGNLTNYGDYVVTSITHLPVIAEMFWNFADEVYPSLDGERPALKSVYLPVLRLLAQEYVVPVLRCSISQVSEDAYLIRDSLAGMGAGFSTQWESLPKARDKRMNDAVLNWLQGGEEFQLAHDLIQIGTIDHGALSRPSVAKIVCTLCFDDHSKRHLQSLLS